jgi:soluble lytic murein transglycosylase-like protein
MTKKYFVLDLLKITIITISLFFYVATEHRANATLTAKNKLLRRALRNFQWEVEQAHSRNQELDAMRWEHRQTKLRYPEWLAIIDKIYFYSKLYDVRPELSMSVAHRESFFIVDARSNVAWGLFQINLEVWKDELKLNEQNVLDLDTNIRCGIWILKQYLVDCGGDEIQALNKYWTGSVIPPHDGYTKRIYSSKFMLTK